MVPFLPNIHRPDMVSGMLYTIRLDFICNIIYFSMTPGIATVSKSWQVMLCCDSKYFVFKEWVLSGVNVPFTNWYWPSLRIYILLSLLDWLSTLHCRHLLRPSLHKKTYSEIFRISYNFQARGAPLFVQENCPPWLRACHLLCPKKSSGKRCSPDAASLFPSLSADC
jgi:hypothetical protein